MLPDPTTLRDAAGVLTALGDDLRATTAGVAGTEETTRWAAPLVDELRRELAGAGADGERAAQELAAAATHLRALASALEELLSACARLHDAREQELRAELAAPGPGAGAATLALAGLPGPRDPCWAAGAGVAPVALPLTGGVHPRPVAHSPSGLVTADLPGVRGLGAVARQAGASAATAARTAAVRAEGLGLPALDAYGLGGSRSAAWLARLGGAGSAAAQAAAGWEDAGRRCLALVGLLERADAGRLLADPRLGLALAVAAAPDPEAARAALAGLGKEDAAWVVDLLPAPPASAAEPAPRRRCSPRWPDWLRPSWLDWSTLGTDVTLLPGEVAGRMSASAAAVLAEARRLELAAAAGSAAARAEVAAAPAGEPAALAAVAGHRPVDAVASRRRTGCGAWPRRPWSTSRCCAA